MAQVHTRPWRLDRRTLLRGAGVSIALPLLERMRVPQAGAQDGDRDALPARCVFLYVPNGMNMPTWQPLAAGPDFALTEPLRPLAPQRGDFTVFSGLHHANGIGQAHECDKIWLTGAPRRPGGGAAFANSLSLDQRIAEVVGAQTRVPSLELALTGGTLAWSRSGAPLPAERRPGAVFERLFRPDPGGEVAARERLQTRASVLDLVLDQARRLRQGSGAGDRSKLDEYLTALREVEQRTQRAEAWLDRPLPAVEPDRAQRIEGARDGARARELYRASFELIALALQTDTTRVVSCMLGSEQRGLALPEIGVLLPRHELSHHGGDPEQMRRLSAADTFHTQELARFLELLAAKEEQGERLLDRTLVLYGSGMAYGHSHGNANLPTLLAGGRALGLAHQGHVDFNLPHLGAYDLEDLGAYYGHCVQPVDPDARLADLFLTLLQRFDPRAESFADSARSLDVLLA